MKFSLESDLEFEAKSHDEALLKLALHFISLMEMRPVLCFKDRPPIDAFGSLINNVPSLKEPAADGYIDVDVHGDYAPPEMLQ